MSWFPPAPLGSATPLCALVVCEKQIGDGGPLCVHVKQSPALNKGQGWAVELMLMLSWPLAIVSCVGKVIVAVREDECVLEPRHLLDFQPCLPGNI